MTFTSLPFLALLGLAFGLHWLFPSRSRQNLVLLTASYAFYAWWDVRLLSLLILSSLVDYTAARGIDRASTSGGRRGLLILSLAVNLGMLATFKYLGFFVDSFRDAAAAMGWRVAVPTLHLVLPVGISFYTFQTMGYTIDVYRGRVDVARRLLDYLVYVSFFPQLVAGPIERAGRLLPQFSSARTFSHEVAVDGCRQALWGVSKKILLADNLAAVVDAVYAKPGLHSGASLVLATIFFAMQIYADFSAYSDIAIGTAKLFGIRLVRNFACPYFARNPVEFWRRWHVSLSTWFRDYVYIPLGGSRRGDARMVAALVLTFAISGLWHGAAWTFLTWGVLHGLVMIPFVVGGRRSRFGKGDLAGGEERFPSPRTLGAMAATFGFTCFAWVLFRAESLGDAWTIWTSILVWARPAGGEALPLGASGLISLALLSAACLVVEWITRREEHPLARLPSGRAIRWGIYTALLWMSVLIGASNPGPFVYFQF